MKNAGSSSKWIPHFIFSCNGVEKTVLIWSNTCLQITFNRLFRTKTPLPPSLFSNQGNARFSENQNCVQLV